MKKAQKKTLIARFYDIQPSLLLFLRRLRQIKIIDEVLSDSREMVRRDLGDNLIELKHSSGVDLWFVVKKELPASNMKPEIETTEIALAFPVPTANSDISVSLEDIKTQISGKSFVQQPVFAFLPLRSYGFRFIVQADFDVPSSREDVDKDSAWNQWLRQEISRLFLQAFDDLKDHPYFDGVSSIVQFLQFIPLENEILDFFKPVTTVIHEGIRRKACVPCLAGKLLPNDDAFREPDALLRQEGIDESSEQPIGCNAGSSTEDNVSGSELKWVFPSQVVIAEDPLIQDLIGDADLSRYLNKFYLHPDVQPFLNQALCRVLGIDSLSCRHLIDIGKAISGESSHVSHSLEDFSRWVAKWLCCVYRCLEHERDCSEETLKNIASLSIFPLADGQLTKLSGQPVFLPLEKTVKGEQTSSKASKKAAEIIHKDLRSLHPMLLSSLDDIGRPQARKLLEQLQVKCLTSRDLIKHHIIPSLQSNQKQIEKSPEVLCSFIIYIKDQWDLDPTICDLEQLSTCALLKTNKGFVNPVTQPVHFTVEYGNEINLEKDFPSVPWTLLDTIYLGISKKTPSSCEKFFSSLGVVHFIAIERKDVCLSKSELLKKLEAKGREAFLHGDIAKASRFFTQALEKQSNSNHCATPESKRKRDALKSQTRSMASLNNNDGEQVWILQSTDQKGKRNKKSEKTSFGKKKEEKVSCLDMLDDVVVHAETTINTYPCYPLGYLRKASVLILLNQWEEARKTYTTGLDYCPENPILKSALLNLNRTHKITSCAANLDLAQLADIVNQNSILPPTPSTLRRNKFRLQSQRRLTKKRFPSEIEAVTTRAYFRRRNSSSTDTHL